MKKYCKIGTVQNPFERTEVMTKKRLRPGVVLLEDVPVVGDDTPDGGETLQRSVEVVVKAALVEMGHKYLGVQCCRGEDGTLTCEAIHLHQKVPDHWIIEVKVERDWDFGGRTVSAIIKE